MSNTIYQQGRDAFMVIDPRKCPYTDSASRQAWFKGYEDAKAEFELDGFR